MSDHESQVTRLYHPSHRVPSPSEAEAWFERGIPWGCATQLTPNDPRSAR